MDTTRQCGKCNPIYNPKKNKEESVMVKKEMIDGLIANEATQFTEVDRQWMEALHEDQLTIMEPIINEDDEFEPCCPDAVAALIANENSKFTAADSEFLNLLTVDQLEKVQPVIVTKEVKVKANAETPKTLEEFLASAPGEMKDVLQSGVEMHRAKKDSIITTITANKRNKFTKEQLSVKDLSELEAIAALAHAPDYSGRGGQEDNLNTNAGTEEALETPVINWDEKK